MPHDPDPPAEVARCFICERVLRSDKATVYHDAIVVGDRDERLEAYWNGEPAEKMRLAHRECVDPGDNYKLDEYM